MGTKAGRRFDVRVKRTIVPIRENHHRTGTFNETEFHGWDYKDGWIISSPSIGKIPGEQIWVEGTVDALRFYSVRPPVVGDQFSLEIEVEPIELSPAEIKSVFGMLWQWEIWEPITIAGTCAIDSLERMLDLSRDVLLDWFRAAGRDPSIKEHIIATVEEHGYTVTIAGPEGFGMFRDFRRLVSMYQKTDPTKGHVVLIYEDDGAIFDSSGVFKKVSDIVMSGIWGYDRGFVLRIVKKRVELAAAVETNS
jgi:hypothetical protein